MSFATMAPAPARQAALSLHALSDADRSWVLAALPSGQREQLQLLLDELLALGIPRDATLAAGIARVSAPAAPRGDWLQELDARGTTAMASVLRKEPVEFTRAVLALVPASALHGLEEALDCGAPGTPRVEPPLAPALERAVRTALETRWKDAMAHQVDVKRPTGWRALGARVASFAGSRRA